MRRFAPFVRRLGGYDLFFLAGLVVFVATGWLVVELVEEVLEGEHHAWDVWVLEALRAPGDRSDPLGPRWFEEGVRDLTALGGTAVLGILTLAAAGYLAIDRKFHTAAFVVGAALGGALISAGLKSWLNRPRPAVVPWLTNVESASFPSGHAQLAAVVYLTLGAVLSRTAARPAQKVYLMAVACLLAVLVGVSRVYLGVHYPSDVVGGWAVGAMWAWACWLLANRLARRRVIEPAAGAPSN